jgi:two-component system, NarL family, invasion response regulator UvrY
MHLALIDDHFLLVQSLSGMLSKYDFIKSIQTFKSAQEYLNTPHNPEPDIIISDIMMPNMNGIEFLTKLKKDLPKTKIILLSSIIEVQTIRHALRVGANGYLSKDASVEELADALLTVYNGEQFIGESLQKAIIRTTLIEDQFVYRLSPREKEVLNLVCSGKTIKETAYEMELSVNTVQTYYKTIMKKFNVNRTADLIVFAMQNGLYQPGKY